MLFKTLNGRDRDVSLAPYLIDWDRVVSGPQKAVKDFLFPYWSGKTVCEEFKIPASRMRVDLLCINDSIMVEVDGAQHDKLNLFMHGSVSGFTAAIKRDLEKQRWAELNGLQYIVIKQHEIPLLSCEWIEKTFGVVL